MRIPEIQMILFKKINFGHICRFTAFSERNELT